MGEIVNLNRARKEHAKAQAKATAAANRATHGLSKIERQTAKAARDRADRLIEGHAREKKAPAED